jgi:hypothetical protein
VKSVIGRAIHTDPQLNALGVTKDTFYTGDPAVDNKTLTIYVVARYLGRTTGVGESRPQGVTFYVHDRPNDFTRINAIIYRIRQVLTALGPQKTDTGWITQVDWLTDGDEISDDATRTILRQTSFSIIASGA